MPSSSRPDAASHGQPGSGSGLEAVIFDLDGVLVDTEIWWDEVRLEFAARRGLRWTEADRAACMGQNSRQWSVTMHDRLGIADEPSRIEREVVDAVLERYRTSPAPTIEGAIETVLAVRARFRTAIASSAHREVIDAALDVLELHGAFDAVVSSDDVPRGKPAPDVYLAAAGAIGVAPERCLVVEDSLNGVLAGRAAGMRVVLVPNAAVPPAPGAREAASEVVGSIGELLPLLGRGG